MASRARRPSLSKTWNVAKLTSEISSSYSCLLTGAELAPFMPVIAADAPLASDNESPAAPSASTTLLRRFRGVTRFVGGMTLPYNTSALNGGPVLFLARTLGKCQKRQKSSADEQVFASLFRYKLPNILASCPLTLSPRIKPEYRSKDT